VIRWLTNATFAAFVIFSIVMVVAKVLEELHDWRSRI
jgi:hypothetical protein